MSCHCPLFLQFMKNERWKKFMQSFWPSIENKKVEIILNWSNWFVDATFDSYQRPQTKLYRMGGLRMYACVIMTEVTCHQAVTQCTPWLMSPHSASRQYRSHSSYSGSGSECRQGDLLWVCVGCAGLSGWYKHKHYQILYLDMMTHWVMIDKGTSLM